MKILITGFEPFGGETVNPAWEAVQGLPKVLAGASLLKLRIPTAFNRAAASITNAMAQYRPDAILMVGQAGGRSALTPEFIGINWQDGRIPDNDGFQPLGTFLEPDEETAYFSTLSPDAMVARIRAAGIPAFVSYSAGTYVCNAVLYRVLHHVSRNGLPCRAGFIHVPFAPEQAVGKSQTTPTMATETIRQGLEAALMAIIRPDAGKPQGSFGQTE